MRRRLALARETLAELTPDNLVSVVGAAAGPEVPTRPVTVCPGEIISRKFQTCQCATGTCA